MTVHTSIRVIAGIALLAAAAVVVIRLCSEDSVPPSTGPNDSPTTEWNAPRAGHEFGMAEGANKAAGRSQVADLANTGEAHGLTESVDTAFGNALTVYTCTHDWTRIGGCSIALKPARAHAFGARTAIPMVEQASGVHVVKSVPAGQYDVVALVPFVNRTIGTVALKDQGMGELTVIVARRDDLIGGVVTDRSGGAVAGVVVDSVGGHSPCPTEGGWCVTDKSGRFAFHRAEGSSSQSDSFVVLDSRAEAGIEDYSVPVELQWGDMQHILRVDPRKRASIYLVDSNDQPIADFVVEAQSRNAYDAISSSATADNAGVARMLLPTGRVNVLVVPPKPYTPIWAAISIASDGHGHAVFKTSDAVPLRGVIVGGADDLADQEITAWLTLQHDENDRSSSAENSYGVPIGPIFSKELQLRSDVHARRFEFFCDPRNRFVLRVSARGYLPVERSVSAEEGVFPLVTVQIQADYTLTATLEPRAAVEWLHQYANQTVSGGKHDVGTFLLVKQGESSNGRTLKLTAKASSGGHLKFNGVSRGKWLLRLVSSHRQELLRSIDVDGEASLQLGPIDLEHLRPGRVTGICTWHQGLRPTLINVRARHGGRFNVGLEQDGRFEFLAPTGEYLIGVNLLSETNDPLLLWNAKMVHVSPGSHTVTALKAELQQLEVRVVDRATGAGVAGAILSIDEERATMVYQSMEANADGGVTIFPCPLGEFGLSLWDDEAKEWRPIARAQGLADNPLVVPISR